MWLSQLYELHYSLSRILLKVKFRIFLPLFSISVPAGLHPWFETNEVMLVKYRHGQVKILHYE